uniref:Reverse transcriptase domain-containing protein n=1 Tax=Syphacia muris TaxID=451379 RepID=A0A0N5ANP9_9BILA
MTYNGRNIALSLNIAVGIVAYKEYYYCKKKRKQTVCNRCKGDNALSPLVFFVVFNWLDDDDIDRTRRARIRVENSEKSRME